jgi:hypothetical protein
MVCCTPPARMDVESIFDFSWSRVKLPVWLSTFLFAITCVTDVQMGHASPFSTSTFQYLSNDIRNSSMQGVLTSVIALWRFGSPSRLPLSQWKFTWECEFPSSHSFTLFLACAFASLRLGRKSKTRVATLCMSFPSTQALLTYLETYCLQMNDK